VLYENNHPTQWTGLCEVFKLGFLLYTAEVIGMDTYEFGGNELSMKEVEQLFFDQMKLVSRRSARRW
jgi:hypothetical protein